MPVPKSARFRPLKFVLTAFLFWFLFTALTKIVLSCAYALSCTWGDVTTRPVYDWRTITLVLIALAAGLWVSQRIFYSEDDMLTPDDANARP